jgi:hypothetical protein
MKKSCGPKGASQVTFACGVCGTEVTEYESNLRRSGRSGSYYCSTMCAGQGRRKLLSVIAGGDGVERTKAEKDAAHYRKNAQAIRDRSNAYHAANKPAVLTRVKAKNRALKQAVIDAYGGSCECCGEATFEFLTIDHIDGSGHKHRKLVGKGRNVYRDLQQRGFPKEGFRLLCFNCNIARGFYGYCPHHPEDREDQGKKLSKNPGRRRSPPDAP